LEVKDMERYEADIVVVGGGPGGYVASIKAAQEGMKVVCVEKEALLGGTCLRVGCIPTKALLETSLRFYEAKKVFHEHGIAFGDISIDLKKAMKRKERVVNTLAGGISQLFKKNKITRLKGQAKIVSPSEVVIDEGTVVQARHILIATGSKPAGLPFAKFGKRINTSDEALAYEECPKHLVVIGAGAVGLELGMIWNRLGAKVTVLEVMDRILLGFDLDMTKKALKAFEAQGIEIRLGAKVLAVHEDDEKALVEVEGQESIQCDRVLIAVGRTPNTDGLGCEEVGITKDKKGFIVVEKGYKTNVGGIFAVGDVIGGLMLAHKAMEEGVMCINGLLGKFAELNYDAIPRICYTEPEVASVGKTEEELKAENREYKVGRFPFRANGRAHTMGYIDGEVKVLADAKSDKLLGMHMVGPRASELIALGEMALEFGASSEDIAMLCEPHPTLEEAIKEACLAVASKTIHL
jgi:dihydrolipoamide dehydrogenase